MKINENICPGINWQCAGIPPTLPSLQVLLKSMQIKQHQLKWTRIHVLASIGNVQASPHPPYFSQPLGTVPNAMYDGNQYAKKEVGGRGGAYKFPACQSDWCCSHASSFIFQ